MSKFGIAISGMKEVRKALSDYGKTKDEEMRDVINKAALNIDREAKLLVPVDTGRLRSSIHAVPENSTDDQTGETTGDMEAKVVTNVEYAPRVEHGIGQRAQPYLVPAFEKVRPEVMKEIERILNRI